MRETARRPQPSPDAPAPRAAAGLVDAEGYSRASGKVPIYCGHQGTMAAACRSGMPQPVIQCGTVGASRELGRPSEFGHLLRVVRIPSAASFRGNGGTGLPPVPPQSCRETPPLGSQQYREISRRRGCAACDEGC